MNQRIFESIREASTVIGTTWPLHTFVASNPLSGYEKTSFPQAVALAKNAYNADMFPDTSMYTRAWEDGDIDGEILYESLREANCTMSAEECLKLFETQKKAQVHNQNHTVDRILVKWLSAFMDEGLAEWKMPYKHQGFYQAWRQLTSYDPDSTSPRLQDIPKTSEEALTECLKNYTAGEYVSIFEYHLAQLPGWVGYIKYREESGSDWQQKYPITLTDYLAVRLLMYRWQQKPLVPKKIADNKESDCSQIQYIWLKAWEQSWQNQLIGTLNDAATIDHIGAKSTPDAQMVFCIDTRSENIRRHVEASGNYETYGYAGFFGITMDYKETSSGVTRKSCPPIVTSAYVATEKANYNTEEKMEKFLWRSRVTQFYEYFLKRMKNMLPSAFGYVEGTGFFYGMTMVARSLLSNWMYCVKEKRKPRIEAISQPELQKVSSNNTTPVPVEEEVAIVKSAFDLMGWRQFASVVLFVGHGSHSANNPFSSSLDCGACAASPGRNNARLLARLANKPNVRHTLRESYNILIPDDTIFVGAEHNTTTDDIILFDTEVPLSHRDIILSIKENLSTAQSTAIQERLGSDCTLSDVHSRAHNWSETRPEWGLATNAGFIVGPRSLTRHSNLNNRCFLHSYDWTLDKEGKALEAIMQGPMVVTQWINTHYYFSTVDNEVFGGGSKITHNITGNFGVVQGNGGDLKFGLPLQSVFQSDGEAYHKPLRLSVVIEAPIDRVSNILAKHSSLRTLLDNEWIHLLVIDPTAQREVFRYKKSIQWIQVSLRGEGGTNADQKHNREPEPEEAIAL